MRSVYYRNGSRSKGSVRYASVLSCVKRVGPQIYADKNRLESGSEGTIELMPAFDLYPSVKICGSTVFTHDKLKLIGHAQPFPRAAHPLSM